MIEHRTDANDARATRPAVAERLVLVEHGRVAWTRKQSITTMSRHQHASSSRRYVITTAAATVASEIGGRHRAERRVGDVPAIELAERQQVQRRGQHPEPGCQHHRMQVDDRALRDGAEDQPPHRAEEQRLADDDERFGRGGTVTRATAYMPENERRDQHDEAGDRAGDADVEEDLARRKGLADPDDRAQRPDLQRSGAGIAAG